VSPVDKSGRVADRGIVRALGWAPGTRLDIREQRGVVAVAAASDGVYRVDARGHVCLPLAVRRWCAITTGTRILFAADVVSGLLRGYPEAALDVLLATANDGGGAW
jgi:hypothetical protein